MTKQVIYMGQVVVIPSRVNYLATSSSGKLLGFTRKPRWNTIMRAWVCLAAAPVLLDYNPYIKLTVPPKDSLKALLHSQENL